MVRFEKLPAAMLLTSGRPDHTSRKGTIMQETTGIVGVREEAVAAAAVVDETAIVAREDALMLDAEKSVAAGERGLRAGYFLAGQYIAEYRASRLARGHHSEMINMEVVGRVARHSGQKIDAFTLIAAYQAHELLDGADKWRAVPYSHFARQYRKFLERQVSADGKVETYVLLPNAESLCIQTFERCAAETMVEKEVEGQVSALVKSWRIADNEKKAKAKEETAKAKLDAQRVLDAQKKEVAELREELAKMEEEAKAAPEEAKEAKAKEVQEAKSIVAKEEAEQKRIKEEADAKAKAARQAENAATAAQRAVDRLLKSPEGKAGKGAKNRVMAEETPVNILAVAKSLGEAGKVKDVAEMVVEMIADDDTLEACLTALGKSDKLSNKSKRAIKGALVALHRVEAPVNASANGRAVAVA